MRNEQGEVPAELTGKFLHAAASAVVLPCVGDWVCVQYHDDDSHASIHDLMQRRSFLQLKSPGKNIDYQMIAANIDVAFIVQSLAAPSGLVARDLSTDAMQDKNKHRVGERVVEWCSMEIADYPGQLRPGLVKFLRAAG